mgnify:CR=1 FL=1
MNISTRGRYGVMAMAELAMQHGSGPVPLKTIAERQGLSENYLEQLFASLRKAGLVRSVRGATGGYLLARDPAQISVGDVLRVLEGPLAPAECAIEGSPGYEHCGNVQNCLARSVWVRLKEEIDRVVDGISLASLCEEARTVQPSDVMYYI